MDRTKEFFPKEIMIKKEFKEDSKGNLKEVTVKDYETLAKIFLDKLNDGYDVTTLEALELLDVDRDWLLNNFRNEFDYFIVPKGVVVRAMDDARFEKFLDLTCKKYSLEKENAKYALQFKRMFINRQSFYEFIFKCLKITESLSVVKVENSEVNQLSESTLTMLKNEFLVKNQLATIDKKTKELKHTEFIKYEDIDADTFNSILDYDYEFDENRGLKSPATLKAELLSYYRQRNRLLLVSNEQLKRKLNQELGLIKFSIVREDSERHPVRYFLKAPVGKQLDSDCFTFTVSAKYDDKLDIIAKQFTAYVLNYLEEKEKKSKKKKSHR